MQSPSQCQVQLIRPFHQQPSSILPKSCIRGQNHCTTLVERSITTCRLAPIPLGPSRAQRYIRQNGRVHHPPPGKRGCKQRNARFHPLERGPVDAVCVARNDRARELTPSAGLDQLQGSLRPLRQARQRARGAAVARRPVARVRPEPDPGRDRGPGEGHGRRLSVEPWLSSPICFASS